MKAYLLVQTASGADPIAWELRNVPGVTFAEDLQGPYDAIVLTAAGQPLDKVVPEIRSLSGVTRVLAAPVIDPQSSPRDKAA